MEKAKAERVAKWNWPSRSSIFGPVVTLTSFRNEAQARRMANATDYGLASYV